MPGPLQVEHRGEIGRLRRLGAPDRRAHAPADGKTETRLAKGVEQEPRDGVHASAPDGFAVSPRRARRRVDAEAHIDAERQNQARTELRGVPRAMIASARYSAYGRGGACCAETVPDAKNATTTTARAFTAREPATTRRCSR